MQGEEREDVRVVVVDDDADSAASLKMLLELDGYNVRTAHNAATALELVEQHQPVCVLLDIGLPDMDGNQLATELRARHGGGLALVAITGRSGEKDRIAAEKAGVDFVLVKPLDVAALQRMLPPIR